MSRPIIPILSSYLLGLAVGYYTRIPFHITILVLFISASLTAASLLIKKVPAVFFAFSMLTLFILGIGRIQAILIPFLPENHIANLTSDGPLSIEGTISESPEKMLDKTRLYVDLSALYFGDAPYPITGRVLLTIGSAAPKDKASPLILDSIRQHDNSPLPQREGQGESVIKSSVQDLYPIFPTLPLRGKECSDENKLRYGDTIRFLAKVKRPRNFHNPGGFDYERYLALKGIFATAYLRDAEGIIITSEAGTSFKGWIEAIRKRIREHLFKNAGSAAPVLISLITGEQGEIPKETREAFSKAGTAHILAISGEHVGLIIMLSFAFVIWLLKRSERAMLTLNIYKVAAIMSIPAITVYSLIAGGGFSIVRAAVMGGAVLAAILSDRRKDIPSLVASAAFLILAFEPKALFDISFQLSFASVISLILILPLLARIYNRDQDSIIEKANTSFSDRLASHSGTLALLSIAATLGTAPLAAYYFNRVSVISPIANLITVPIIGFIVVPLGLLSAMLIPVSSAISGWLVSIISWIISVIIKLTGFIAAIPFASIRVVTPNLFEMALFYLIIILFIYRNEFKLAARLLIPATAVLLCVESFCIFSPLLQKDLKVSFLDVGQSESTLIEFPGGKRMLIDGGGLPGSDFDIGERVVAPFLWHKKISRIDYLVLSHPNFDHYGGLPFILRNFNVGEVWESGIEEQSQSYEDFKNAVRESGALYKKVREGDSLSINGINIRVLNPPINYTATDDKASNNGSLVLKLDHGKNSFLFTGDIEKEAEALMSIKGTELKSTVLKVPHHGSLTSSTAEFITRVGPDKAVFSVGYKNRFGFPKEEVLERYRNRGCEIFRTDKDGAISAVSDGKNIRVAAF